MSDDRRKHNDDYLWTGTGIADPEIARLERTLAPLRYEAADIVVRASRGCELLGDDGKPCSVFGVRCSEDAVSEPRTPNTEHRTPWRLSPPAPGQLPRARCRRGRPHHNKALALAAVLALTACAAWFAFDDAGANEPGWALTPAGIATINRRPVSTPAALPVGRWLETGADGGAELSVADIGSLTVHPRSRLRIKETRAGEEHRVQLARGKIEAFIYAPPRLFFVDTPAAVAVDLGCVYELEVDERGNGELFVTLGWVMLENGTHAVTVPAEARCPIRADGGPGVPRFDDAPAALVDALSRLDDDRDDEAALAAALESVRPRDRLSLWHLLPRVDPTRRPRVLAAMTAFAPLPPGVSPDAVLALDPDALDSWWAVLDRSW